MALTGSWILTVGCCLLALGIVPVRVRVFLTLLWTWSRLRLLLSRWDAPVASLCLCLATASVFFLNAFKHLRNLLFNVRTCVRCSPRWDGDDDDDDEDRLAPSDSPYPNPFPIPKHFHFYFYFQLRLQLPRLWRDDEANITNLRVINQQRRPSHSWVNQLTRTILGIFCRRSLRALSSEPWSSICDPWSSVGAPRNWMHLPDLHEMEGECTKAARIAKHYV